MKQAVYLKSVVFKVSFVTFDQAALWRMLSIMSNRVIFHFVCQMTLSLQVFAVLNVL